MTQNYESLLQDMISAKKDFGQLKVRNAQLQCELKFAREQANDLRKQSDKLARDKHSLEGHVKSLEMQLDQLRSSYETTVQTIKAEVDSRQAEIQSAKDQISPQLDFQMMRLKIMRELEEQYSGKLSDKEESLEEARNLAEQARREKELLEEKLVFQERQLARTVNEMRQSHIDEIENLTRAVSKMKSGGALDDTYKETNKKLRRDNEQLRCLLIEKEREVDELRDERARLKNETSGSVVTQTKLIEKLRDEVRIHRDEVDRLHKQLSGSTADRDRLMLTQKEKEMRKLELDIEQLHQQLRIKDSKMNRLSETIAQLEVEIVRVNSKQQITQDRQNLQITRHTLQQLQQDHRQLQERFEDTRRIKEELSEKEQRYRKDIKQLKETVTHLSEREERYRRDVKDLRESTTQNKDVFRDFRKEDLNDIKHTNVTNRQHNTKEVSNVRNVERYDTETHTTNIKTIIRDNQDRVREAVRQASEQHTKQTNSIRVERDRFRKELTDLKKSTVELEKKYEITKEKLRQANTKIMELLQHKIRTSNSPDTFKLANLHSPTPTLKKVFNFTSEQKTVTSPQNQPTRDPIHTDDDHRRQFLSPQLTPSYAAGRNIDITFNASRQSGRGSDDFYQKSKSFRASKGRVVCLNHQT